MYTDAHSHLNSDQLYPLRERHLQDFIDIGGSWLIIPGTGGERNDRALAISRALYPTRNDDPCQIPSNNVFLRETRVDITLGIHPCMLQDNARTSSDIDTTIAALSYQIANNRERVVAVGECGFDLYWTAGMHDQDLLRLTTLQEDLFVKQCLLARFYDLPVVIHSRNAWHQTRHVVKQFPDVIFYFHCWGYEPEQVSVLVEHMPKSFLGFCGNITYPKAGGIQQSLLHLWNLYKQSPHRVPRFVIETDAPYLSPQQVRGSVNSPKHCQYTYAHIADMLNISVYEVQAYTYQSMSELFSR